MSHTPGPWEARWNERNKRTHTGEWYWVAPETQFLKQSINVRTKSRTGEAEANARLIAAAPELIAACRAIVERWENGDLAESARMCAAAIAKAEGRQA